MICKMLSTGYNFLLFIFTIRQSATTLKPLTADEKKIDHFTTVQGSCGKLWVVWMNTKDPLTGQTQGVTICENSYWTNAKTFGIHLHILTYKLTCHCKPLLRLRLQQESLLQLAGHNDTLHSLPVMRRSERDGGQQERLGGAQEKDVIKEKDTMEGEVERNTDKSKFLLKVCCISATS